MSSQAANMAMRRRGGRMVGSLLARGRASITPTSSSSARSFGEAETCCHRSYATLIPTRPFPSFSTVAHQQNSPDDLISPLSSKSSSSSKASTSSLSSQQQQWLTSPVTQSLDDPDLFQQVSFADVSALAMQRPTPLRLADMYKYGQGVDWYQRLHNAQFLHKELPIRIAQRVIDLLTLPHGLSQAEPIRHVAAIYVQYLDSLLKCPLPMTVTQEDEFTDLLRSLVLDRTSVPVMIARGVQVWRHSNPHNYENGDVSSPAELEMEDCLYRFFTARCGLRFLTEHHVLSSPRRQDAAMSLRNVTHVLPVPDTMGCIQTNCNVVSEVSRVAEWVRQQSTDYLQQCGFEKCPEMIIVDCNREQQGGFTYVPHHLHYMLAELLKNSVRATLRKHGNDCITTPLPPIKVIIAKGMEDVTIKIADRGGGIPRSRMQTIWKFAHSTAGDDELESNFGTDVVSGARIRGFGLPLARIYARYFGGELTLKSTEGYGLDAYLYIPRLGESCENLPLRVRDSPGERDSLPMRLRHSVQDP